MGSQCRFSAPAAGETSVSAREFLSEGVSYCDLLSFVQLAQRPLFRAAPGAYLLLYSRSLKRPGFPRANRRMFEERLLLGIGVELPDARWIAVHEHRKARTEGFFRRLPETRAAPRDFAELWPCGCEQWGAAAGSKTS